MQREPQSAAIPAAVAPAGPVAESARISSLDLIRGAAVLGILLMNAVSFKYGSVPYWNISAGGMNNGLDWAAGVFGEVFIDQKFMGLFSLLFGAGIMLFLDRAAVRNPHPVRLNLWRNGLLLAMGLLHALLWQGDVLTIYAISALFLLALRRRPAKTLLIIGAALFLLTAVNGLLMQFFANAAAAPLAGLWKPAAAPLGQGEPADNLLLLITLFNYFLRGLGLILLGAGLYRTGFMHGARPARTYRLTALVGLGLGLPLAAAGLAFAALNEFSREVAFLAQIPNTLGTIPAALGYLSLIVLWNKGQDSWLKGRLRAVGRMALTNYLAQSLLGVLILTHLLADAAIGRSGVLVFVLAVWALQLGWSAAWLNHFRFGPMEWLWRTATYRRAQPLRR